MNIEEMQAGAEMDRMVAEKVMGWKPSPPGEPPEKRGLDGEPFSPSTNIAHAWEVVEMLRSRGFHFHHGDMACFGPPQERRAAFYDVKRDTEKNEGWQPYEATARTDTLAICLAALKAWKKGKQA